MKNTAMTLLYALIIFQAGIIIYLVPAIIPVEIFTTALFIGTLYYYNKKTALLPEETKPQKPNIDFDPTIQIAHETLPYLRSGLNEDTALKIAEIIKKISDVPAVAITDKDTVLAFLGVGCDKHHAGDVILTDATKQVLQSGLPMVVQSTLQLSCSRRNTCDCPLKSAVIMPLKKQDEVVGTLKLYQTKDDTLPPYVIQLAAGIAQLLGLQLELAELDHKSKLLIKAKLDALNAQINPHFFFNTLNTIIMYSRANPERARRLLIRLADFFRFTFKQHKGDSQSLREELEYIHTYLVLERARFGNKLKIIEDIDYDLLDMNIPLLSLQPLVENAIKHGITTKVGEGSVKISVHRRKDEVELSISDDGFGIPADKLEMVLIPGYGSGNGVGLSNVHERLKSIYGEDSGLLIKSSPGHGTKVYFKIPFEDMEGDTKHEAENTYSR